MGESDAKEPEESKPSKNKETSHDRKTPIKGYHRRTYRKEGKGTIEKQRKEARDEMLQNGILHVLDERKKHLRDHEDKGAAVDIGIISAPGGVLYVAALRWEIEELKKDVLVSKALRITFDPAQQSAAVSYLTKNEDEKLEWSTDETPRNPLQLSDTLTGTFTSADLHDTISKAMDLANVKSFDNRRIENGVLSANPPGIGRETF